MSFTILEDGRKTSVDARIDGDRILVSPADLERALGWTLKPQGLCQGETCMPLGPSSGVVRDGSIDLDAFAAFMDRPLAKDVEAGAACLGESAIDRRAAMKGCLAPDFTLPDLSGRTHSLGDYRGRKALLIAWASW
jgi:hypothetical protein